MIGVTLDHESLRAGEFVTGSVCWSGLAGTSLHVHLRWDVQSNASHPPYNIVRELVQDITTDTETVLPIRFMVPHEGPLTTELTGLIVTWSLRAEARRLMHAVESADAIVTVQPRIARVLVHANDGGGGPSVTPR